MINQNFDIDKLPDEYYDELKENGWLGEHIKILYVTVDEHGTATTVIKNRDSLIILRQFMIDGKIHFSSDFECNFSEI